MLEIHIFFIVTEESKYDASNKWKVVKCALALSNYFNSISLLNKLDLENKSKLERKECEDLKYNLEIQSQKQGELKERSVQEANTKLTTLQQHYKLLKNQCDDLKEECSKTKTSQIEKINTLQNSLDSYKKQKSCEEKDNEIEIWKVQTKKTCSFMWIM